jgi:hypothetical protein
MTVNKTLPPSIVYCEIVKILHSPPLEDDDLIIQKKCTAGKSHSVEWMHENILGDRSRKKMLGFRLESILSIAEGLE